MIQLFNVYFPARTLLLLALDGLLVTFALALSTLAWFQGDPVLAFGYSFDYARILLASAALLLCLHYYDLYDSLVLSSLFEMRARILQALGTVCIVLAVVYFAYPPIQVRRGPLAMWVVVAGLGLVGWRTLFLTSCRAKWLKRRAVILGTGPLYELLRNEIVQRPELGLELIGFVEDKDAVPEGVNGLPRLGNLEDLDKVVRQRRVESVVLALGERRGKMPLASLVHLKSRGVVIQDGSDLYEAVTGRLPLQSHGLISLVLSPDLGISHGMQAYKSITSILVSSVALVLLAPLMALVALAIRLDSKGPAIFRQRRIGQGGDDFTLYKFRSMVVDSGPDRPADEGDKRVTRVGRLIRKVRIDELPQLFNILRGDMCLVGPRPNIPQVEEECTENIPLYPFRHLVKPGATGWAQVRQGYCGTLEHHIERLSYELYYIKHMSFGLDLLIVFQTFKILLLGRGAR